jgi:hypothetical protein
MASITARLCHPWCFRGFYAFLVRIKFLFQKTKDKFKGFFVLLDRFALTYIQQTCGSRVTAFGDGIHTQQ